MSGYEKQRVKDIAMTETADYGIGIWDGKTRGTKQVIDDLKRMDKPVTIFEKDGNPVDL